MRDEDFTWVTKGRLNALLGVASAAKRVMHDLTDEALDEHSIDLLSDMLFVLDREEKRWSGS